MMTMMIMRTTQMTRGIAMGITLGLATMATAAGGTGPDLEWHTVDGGGGASNGGSFLVTGTIGQPDAEATLTGGTWTVSGGFWTGDGATVLPCPTDVDDSGDIGFGDLLAVLAAWGTCEACPEDIDGDGLVGFNDLIQVLASWGPCP